MSGLIQDLRQSMRFLWSRARFTSVIAAATGCRTVLRIMPGGKIETVLKAQRPWSPTGVAVLGDDVYVLKYAHALRR
jgi:hypothetical protein